MESSIISLRLLRLWKAFYDHRILLRSLPSVHRRITPCRKKQREKGKLLVKHISQEVLEK
eukprot:c32624_g1_i1 orf=135-314(+)